jgi:hypothetical protein
MSVFLFVLLRGSCRLLLRRSPTSTKTEQKYAKIDHKWDQSGPGGGGKGQPKINENMKNYKKRKRKEATQEKTLFLKSGAIFSKIGGLNGWAFTEFFQQM